LEAADGVPSGRSTTLLDVQSALEVAGIEFIGSRWMGRESESAPFQRAANEKTLLPAVGAQPNQPGSGQKNRP
jgi:hypothetical protein